MGVYIATKNCLMLCQRSSGSRGETFLWVLAALVLVVFGSLPSSVTCKPEYELPATSPHGFNISVEKDVMSFYPVKQSNYSNIEYYVLSLVMIKERTPEGIVVENVTGFEGTWAPYEDEDPSTRTLAYTCQFTVRPHPEPINFTILVQSFDGDESLSYGYEDYLTFMSGDFGIDLRLSHWPFTSEDNRLTIRFRLARMLGSKPVTGERLIWESQVSAVGHIDGLTIFSEEPLRLSFPILGLQDSTKSYTGIGIDDVDTALEVNINFAYYKDSIFYIMKGSLVSNTYEHYTTALVIGIIVVVAVIGAAYLTYTWYRSRRAVSEV